MTSFFGDNTNVARRGNMCNKDNEILTVSESLIIGVRWMVLEVVQLLWGKSIMRYHRLHQRGGECKHYNFHRLGTFGCSAVLRVRVLLNDDMRDLFQLSETILISRLDISLKLKKIISNAVRNKTSRISQPRYG